MTQKTAVDEFKQWLSEDKTTIDDALKNFLSEELAGLDSSFSSFSKIAMESYSTIASNGGKRLRGSLLLRSYRNFGGTDGDVALRASIAIELVHAYLLVVDDFTDGSDTRRSIDSAHKNIEKFAEANNLSGDTAHFGESVAVTAAIAGMHIASNILLSLDIDAKRKLLAHKDLNDSVLITAHGQFNDMYNEAVDPKVVSREDILNVMRWKTAQYTFFNPIRIGAILAGENPLEVDVFSEFANNAGLAFQIQDDIIGMFGDQKNTGKPTIDDLREGKVTLLIREALDSCSSSDARFVIDCLGSKNLTIDDHKKVKEIIKNCGALGEVQKIAKSYASAAKQDIAHLKISDDFKVYLMGLSELIAQRDR